MPSPAVIKIASGLGALGMIGGGGIALYKSELFKTKTTLGELVRQDKWTLLNSSNTDQISKILEAYKKSSPNKPTLLFPAFNGTENKAVEKLLEECQKASSKLSDDPDKDIFLRQIKKWCVVPKTVSQRLNDLGYKTLSTEAPSGSTNEQSEWVEKGKSHHGTHDHKIKDITTTGDQNNDAKVIREACKKKNETNSYDEDFDDALRASTLWCSVSTSK
ncbi:hypothetical protein MHC_05005 [Mycoplasma haemocanis str. Illinois]|uniref:Uncharacterized protein n=1 Tax=Mycoplasma haemocanis (strain Illinois) TaxID=1111676 RepID=H6N885_MYCHN|nr:hypothetical protein [Mycoplasma haemocanis]AEW45857.1 hypothetical protein MHC_05005 [Mycoplasma haemocanis str. Illinois]